MAKVKAIKKHSYAYGGESISFERGDEFQLVAKVSEKWWKVQRLRDKGWTQNVIYVPSKFMKEVGPDANPQPADRKMSCPKGMSFNTNKNKSVTATLTKVSSLPESTAKSRSNADHPEKLVEPPLQAEDGSNAALSVDLKLSQSSTHVLENPPPLHRSGGGENEQPDQGGTSPNTSTFTCSTPPPPSSDTDLQKSPLPGGLTEHRTSNDNHTCDEATDELLPAPTTPRVVNPQLTAKETKETETDGVHSKTVTATLPKVSSLPELKSTPVISRSNADHPEKLVEPPLQAEDGSNAALSVDLKLSQSSTHVLENPPPLHRSGGGENEQPDQGGTSPNTSTFTCSTPPPPSSDTDLQKSPLPGGLTEHRTSNDNHTCDEATDELLPAPTTPRVVNPQLTAKETKETETDGVHSKTVTATLPKVSSLPELKSTPVISRSNADHPEKLVEPPLQAEDGSNAALSVDLKLSQSSTHVLENPPPLHRSGGGENEQPDQGGTSPNTSTFTCSTPPPPSSDTDLQKSPLPGGLTEHRTSNDNHTCDEATDELLPAPTTPRVVNPQLTAKETKETETDGVHSKTVTATLPKVSSLPELKSTPVISRSNADHPEKLVEPPLQAEDGSNAALSVDLKLSQSSTHVLENPPPLHRSGGGENEQPDQGGTSPNTSTFTCSTPPPPSSDTDLQKSPLPGGLTEHRTSNDNHTCDEATDELLPAPTTPRVVNPQLTAKETKETETDGVHSKTVTATLPKVSSLPELKSTPVISRSNADHPEKLVEPPLQAEDGSNAALSVDLKHSQSSTHVLENPPPLHHNEGGQNEQPDQGRISPNTSTFTCSTPPPPPPPPLSDSGLQESPLPDGLTRTSNKDQPCDEATGKLSPTTMPTIVSSSSQNDCQLFTDTQEPLSFEVEDDEEQFDDIADKLVRHLQRPRRMRPRRLMSRRPQETIEDMTDELAEQLIQRAMKSGTLKQRNVVGVITGLMGSGKTTLLCHLFGVPPPKLYTSTGVVEQSFQTLLHHMVRLSADAWERLSYNDIREFLAPLIRAGMKAANVQSLAVRLVRRIDGRPHESFSPTVVGGHMRDIDSGPRSSSTAVNGVEADTSTPSPQPETSPSCNKMVPLVKEAAATVSSKDIVLDLLHMIDTGGQPELMEVMPSIIHNANVTVVLVNLMYGLDGCPTTNYHVNGVGYERQLSCHYTCRDVILKLVSTLHAKKSLRNAFRILIVATHRDCVEDDLETKVKHLDTELRFLLLPAFKKQLILPEAGKIAFVLGLKNPDESDRKTLESIRTQISKSGLGKPFETPTSFFVFEQDLLQFAHAVAKRDILSLDECKQVGAQLGMSSEMVEAALDLFHRQNTFLYFRHVLPNHVFIDPKVPLDIINGIVRFSYQKLQCVPAKLMSLLEDGIITEELLSYDEISPHFENGFYEVQHAIKLLCYTFIIAPLQPDTTETPAVPVDEKEKEYLMMCLKPAIPNDGLDMYIPKSSDTVPLVMKFSTECVPLGCFGSTISCLLSQYGWEVLREAECGPPKCLAHNIAALRDPDLLVNVVLVDFTQHIEIHIDSDLSIHDLPSHTCSQLYTTVFGAVEKVFKIMQLDINSLPAVVCPCRKLQYKHHATFEKRSGKFFLRCPKTTSIPDEKQLLWTSSDTANSKPTLPQLIQLNIPERVAAKYVEFGTCLLKDDDGNQVDVIREACLNQPDKIVIKILQTWVRKGPTPVTWENLIKILKDTKLNALANYVKKNARKTYF